MTDPVLQNALSRLPQYAPPAGLWEALEAALDAEQHLSGAVRELPVYTPPETIWANIETKLEQAPKQRRTIRAILSMRVLLAAASLLLLLAAVRWIIRPAALPVEETITQQTKQPNQTIASTPTPPNNPLAFKTTPQKPLKTRPQKTQTTGMPSPSRKRWSTTNCYRCAANHKTMPLPSSTSCAVLKCPFATSPNSKP